MTTIDTDYLVVGAGAMGTAFIDTLVTDTDEALLNEHLSALPQAAQASR